MPTPDKAERKRHRRPLGRYARNKETAEYLGISEMTLWRWRRDPKLKFPLPSVINGVERNNLDEVDQWMKAKAVSRIEKSRAKEAA